MRKFKGAYIEEEVWKSLRTYCVKNDLKINEFLEKLIKKECGDT